MNMMITPTKLALLASAPIHSTIKEYTPDSKNSIDQHQQDDVRRSPRNNSNQQQLRLP